ncbi:MAG: AAA family ATPase, partial [Firmicutes bacterium]|nr:AAA family ATPase [Bacillota bacterium]
ADIDKVRAEDGRFKHGARRFVDAWRGYVERSRNGNLRFIGMMDKPPDKVRNRTIDGFSVELFPRNHFVTITGDRIKGSAAEDVTGVFTAWYGSVESEIKPKESGNTPVDLVDRVERQVSENFPELWRGNTGGYSSKSEADAALMLLIVADERVTHNESACVEIFRRSGLADRKKAKRNDYMQRTYTAALDFQTARPELICAASIKPKAVEWLRSRPINWPRGKICMLSGDPGLGKSTYTISLAAQVTRAGGDVLVLTAEDDADDTSVPRLMAHGAKLNRVHFLTGITVKGKRGFVDLNHNLPQLSQALERVDNPQLVIIDPIAAYIGGVDDHRNAELRALLARVQELAAERGVVVLLVSHLRKSGGSAVIRTQGSVAYVAACRACWLMIRDPENPQRRIVAPQKLNLQPSEFSYAFTLDNGRVVWESTPIAKTADELLKDADEPQYHDKAYAQDEARKFLSTLLKDGPISANDAKAQAREAGIASRTLDRAKASLGV